MTYLYLYYIHTYKLELTGLTDRLDVEPEGEESWVMKRGILGDEKEGAALLFGKYFSGKMMRGNLMGDILR